MDEGEEEEEDGGVGEIEGGLVGEMGGDRVCVGWVFKRRVKSRKMGMKNGGSSIEEWGKIKLRGICEILRFSRRRGCFV